MATPLNHEHLGHQDEPMKKIEGVGDKLTLWIIAGLIGVLAVGFATTHGAIAWFQ